MWRNMFQNRRAAIKEGGDNLPMGLCFAAQSGNVLFLNRMMESLSYRLIGESAAKCNIFLGQNCRRKLAKWNCVRKTARAYKRKSVLDPLCKWRVQNIYKVNIEVGRRRNR